MRATISLLGLACCAPLAACNEPSAPAASVEVSVGVSLLTAAERRGRAARIRDAAFVNGMTQGYLLAGIADAETSMSHCWSELTWACMGPASADCGGGPVVAGAGDGPCSLEQGGLGMFQFDAGTYADTLRREGDRVLSIDGNVAAAVDFVVAMLIRSVYVDGVDDAAQAIAWSNGVREGNERWDPWLRTVTHYYNGCTPNADCWAARYAHYQENTSAVRAEMGAEFWEVGRDFAAEYVHQSFPLASQPFELASNAEVAGYIEMRNTGRLSWSPGMTFLGTSEPRDVESALAGPDWLSASRPAAIDREVSPGASGRFAFTVRAPAEPGEYAQYFNLVQEGVAWFGDQGGPPDDQLQVRVTVPVPAMAATAGAGASAGVGSGGAVANTGGKGGACAGACTEPVNPQCGGGMPCAGVMNTGVLPLADAGPSPLADAGPSSRTDGGCSVAPRSRATPPPTMLLVASVLVLARFGRSRRRA